MKIENMELYEKFRTTPKEARKEIVGGRMKGFTDINPMWRIKKLTEEFGPCGIGWHYTVMEREMVSGANGEVKVFVQVALYVRTESGWSSAIMGEGGSSFISVEKEGKLYTDDECYKKATTDALGSACKLLGMSADIYFEKDRTKYTMPIEEPTKPNKEASVSKEGKQTPKTETAVNIVTKQMLTDAITELASLDGITGKEECARLQEKLGEKICAANYNKFIIEVRKQIKEAKK